MHDVLTRLIFAAGAAQLGMIAAVALARFRLNWGQAFDPLPRLHRQMYRTYAGYMGLSIVAFGLISLFHAAELASGSGLARGFSAYVALFWGLRAALQGVLDARPHLTNRWLVAGHYFLTVPFLFLAIVFGWAAIHTAG